MFYRKQAKGTSKLVVAWDLDGTLIDSSHRIRLKEDGSIDLDHWVENCVRKKIFKDRLLPLVDVYREFKKTGFTQICVTARKMVPADFEYLKHHGLEFDLILHREDSTELDEVLKSKKLQEFFSEYGRIPFQAYDDKERNLEIFDKHGFRTFQAAYLNKVLEYDSYKEIKNLKPSQF